MTDKPRIAIYGISTETERALPMIEKEYEVIGLLDGYKTNGEIFGKRIISLEDAIRTGIHRIIIIARPGSRKAIVRRIGDKCRNNDIELYDMYGVDLHNQVKNTFKIKALIQLASEKVNNTVVSDMAKLELFKSRVLKNSSPEANLAIDDAYDIGYIFCAPVITDFVFWLYDKIKEKSYDNVWFSARDGFLIKQLFEILDERFESIYFLTSRSAAIRAGIHDEDDIKYVASMAFSGTITDNMKTRFGIDVTACDATDDVLDFKEKIFDKSKESRAGYEKYLNTIDIEPGDVAFYDFVGKGTTQLFVQKLITNHLTGYYFLQLESEYMKNKNLDIISFISSDDLRNSAIYDNYYILETILTAPHPSIVDFDMEGKPIYAKEIRSQRNIGCIKRIQEGIIDYFKDYLKLVNDERRINKKFDEMCLRMIQNAEIRNPDFLALQVEDMFFNRMTDITDLI